MEEVEVGVEEHDVLNGREAGTSDTTRLKSGVPEGNLEHEHEAKRTKLPQHSKIHPSAEVAVVRRIVEEDDQVLLDVGGPARRETTARSRQSIIAKNMPSPHNDDGKWADMFRNIVFADDVNGGNELDKHLVIEDRKTEMVLFKKWQCTARFLCPRLSNSKARSSRRPGTRTIARGLSPRKSRGTKRQDLFLATTTARDFKVARGELWQWSEASQAFEDWNLRREQGVLPRALHTVSLHQYTR